MGARRAARLAMTAYVYILTNRHHTTLYVGVTSHLCRRTKQHLDKFFPKSFSARYNVNKLVYYEVFDSIVDAIKREKQLKAGSRKQKLKLINNFNPAWKDLFPSLPATGEHTGRAKRAARLALINALIN